MPREPRYYTATGDDGTTGLLGSERVKKYHPRPSTYGIVDEAQAALGLARAVIRDPEAASTVYQIQRDLYLMMSEMAATKENAAKFRKIDAEKVAWLEAQIEDFGARVEMPREFTISGETLSGAALDLARAVVRRAEREIVRLVDDGYLENRELVRYINRLSSLLYVLSLAEERRGEAGLLAPGK
jgi:cob(I)alamin adenosyltransferase